MSGIDHSTGVNAPASTGLRSAKLRTWLLVAVVAFAIAVWSFMLPILGLLYLFKIID